MRHEKPANATRTVVLLVALGCALIVIARVLLQKPLSPNTRPGITSATNGGGSSAKFDDQLLDENESLGRREDLTPRVHSGGLTTQSGGHFGRVLDKRTSKGIAGARIIHGKALDFPNSYWLNRLPATWQALSDDTGYFHLDAVPEPIQCWIIIAKGYEPAMFLWGNGHESVGTAQAVSVDRSGTVRARIVDASGRGRPGSVVLRANMTRKLQPHGEGRSDEFEDAWFVWEATADSQGYCDVIDLPVNVELLGTAKASSQLRAQPIVPIELQPGESRSIDVRIESPRRIRGRVNDARGNAVVNEAVYLEPVLPKGIADPSQYCSECLQVVFTDGKGEFTFDDVSPGGWSIGPTSNHMMLTDYHSTISGQPMLVDIGVSTPDPYVTLVVQRNFDIRGVVLDPWGAPAEGCWVEAKCLCDVSNIVTRTDNDGRFVLAPVLDERYEISARVDGSKNGENVAESNPVIARPGTIADPLHLQEGGSIVSTIRESGDGSRGSYEVTFACQNRIVRDCLRIEAGVPLRLEGIPPGKYSMLARGREQQIALATGIDVRPNETVECGVYSERGSILNITQKRPRDRVSVHVYYDEWLISVVRLAREGTTRALLPAGKVMLRARVDGEWIDREWTVVVGTGEESDVQLVY